MLSMYGLDVFYLLVLAVVKRPGEWVFGNHFVLAVLECWWLEEHYRLYLELVLEQPVILPKQNQGAYLE
jgi:hypothetical protein